MWLIIPEFLWLQSSVYYWPSTAVSDTICWFRAPHVLCVVP